MSVEKEARQKELDRFDRDTQKYILFMCKKGCKFYDNGCTKHRLMRDCARKGLKNKE